MAESKVTAMGKQADKQTAEKPRILRWRGMLASNKQALRVIISLVIAMICLLLTFTQQGFIHITMPYGEPVYLMMLFIHLAVGSLLLGPIAGASIGLVAGAVLYLHAVFLPLDHYELLFISPFSSVVLMPVAAFLMGIFFAIALRNNPQRARRVAYIGIACFISSVMFSAAFSAHAMFALVDRAYEVYQEGSSDAILEAMTVMTLVNLGDVILQIIFDAIIMTILCSLADYFARLAALHRDTVGIRTVFGSWLSVVALMLFMGAVALSLAIATESERSAAQENMQSEVDYICMQLDSSEDLSKEFLSLLDEFDIKYESLDEDGYANLLDLVTRDSMLSGYTLELDGTIIIAADDTIVLSDDPRFEKGANINQAFTPEMKSAINASVASGTMERFIFDEVERIYVRDEELPEELPAANIAFVCASRLELEDVNGEAVTYTVLAMQPEDMVYARCVPTVLTIGISSLLMMVGAFSIVFMLLHRVVAQRIDEENEALARITGGDLNARATAGGSKEFESLSEGINTTVDALKGWIAEAETRMDAELETAKAIQNAALPGIFPPYPDIYKFDIYASMKAARQVGGDFYDFFLIGDDCDATHGKLGFVVADVSGKGVPGALLMMKAKVQIRNYVGSGMELGEAMSEVNRQLCDGNEEGMFVTAWVGVLDYETGRVEYVNAGHNPPLLWQRDGGWRWMRERSGPMLGFFDIPYRAHSIECQPGDTFLLYTDGVTEAFDVNEQLYGEDRLLEVANAGAWYHPRRLLESVRDDVARHAAGAEQSDDITILTLEVGVPPEVTATLEVPAEIDEIERVNDFLHTELDRRLCPIRAQHQLDIAVEELFVNVCNYAYLGAPEPGIVRIQRTYSAEPQSIIVDIIDTGVAFDPLAKPDAVTPKDIRDVPIGGLGILMTKRCVDEIRYERIDGCNYVTIVKRW